MARTTISILAAVVMITAAALVAPSSAAADGAGAPISGAMGMPGCETSCGNVSVPYPFGMGPSSCYHSPGFKLTCDRSRSPPRLLLDEDDETFRVVDITLWSSTVRVVRTGAILNASSHGKNATTNAGFRVPGGKNSPYLLARGNELVLTGCNAVAVLHHGGSIRNSIISGCASFCESDGTSDWRTGRDRVHQASSEKYCSGSGCCQASIYSGRVMDMGLQFSWLNGLYHQRDMSTLPSYVFIAEEGWFDQPGVADQLLDSDHPPSRASLEVPIVLDWSFNSSEIDGRICKSKHSFSFAETCACWFGHDGNPYLTDGCIDVNECEQPEEYGCFGQCTNLPGTFDCRCPPGYHGNHTVPGGCVRSITGLTIGVGVGSGIGAILLFLIALSLTQKLKHRRKQIVKQKFFEQNRGRLLQQLVSQRTDIAERMIITLEELEKATNNFDKTRELGGGGHGTVYKGILSDLHVVAIKKPKKVIQKEIDEFLNEVAILSQINHRNVVKLYGCCLETEVPMLVYEFISNGTLYDHLHVNETKSLSLGDRLRIATETAKSLAHLHTTVSIPIIHRDIKSANILLDDTLSAKVADFGASRYVPVDRTGVTTMVQGTRGYLDPMYISTGRLTEKSDVYSFGVMLLELLTRKKPFSYFSSEGDGLVGHFATLFAEGNMSQILDPQVADTKGKVVEEVAKLALACVKLSGEDRPTMRNVELTLESIQSSKRIVLGDAVVEASERAGTTMNDLPSTCLQSRNESSRQYSMEEEFMLSSRYPR